MGIIGTLRHRWPWIAIPLVLVLTAGAVVYAVNDTDCDGCLRPAGGGSIAVRLKVLGESGEPLEGATVTVHSPLGEPVTLTSDDDGVVEAPELPGPAMAVVTADGHLAEPVPLGWSDSGKQIDTKLFSRGSNRFAVHSAGDVMFGRRYAAPGQEESSGRSEPLIPADDAAAGAEDVVSAIAPAFAAADFRTVNVETVISDKPADAAYPGKRYILQSAGATVAGLRALSADLAVLANNHARDLLDGGVADTRAALSGAGIATVGAGANATEAAEPHRREVAGTGVDVLAYTSVDGSFVNESFPAATTRQPDDVAESDRWQYEARSWGYPETGVPSAPRRIREAWERFSAAEERASDEQVAGMWASLAAVYPEVQDWVARRGHGGAARWDDEGSTAQIKQAAATSPLVMVQVHAGFQFQEAASDNMRDIARKAVDAGADIVVAHHPHVLQGLEWYKGRLIAYSLGNFVFEQNFLATFASAFLRTVWEGDTLLEARLYPLELVDYKPVPVTDSAAERVLARVWERSTLPLESYRDENGDVRTRPRDRGTPAQVVLERHTGRLVADSTAGRTQDREVAPGAVVDLDVAASALVKPAGGGVDIGRDLYGWGHFEDETADAAVSEAVHWSVNSKREGTRPGDAAQGLRALRLEVRDGDSVQSRPIARIPLPRHRAYEDRRGKAVPTDPEPSYSLVAEVRRSSTASAEVRFDIYHFDDSNPAEDPTSEVVATHTKAVDVPADGRWHQVVVDLSVSELDSGGTKGNMVMPYLKVAGSSAQPAWVDVDELRFVEWRDAHGMTSTYGAFTLARNRGATAATLPYEVLLPVTP